MTTQAPWYQPYGTAAPEYSQLPEVSASFLGTHAPELVSRDSRLRQPQSGAWAPLQQQQQQQPQPQPPSSQPPPPVVDKLESSASVNPASTSEPLTPGYPRAPGSPTSVASDDAPAPRRTTVVILSILVAILAAAVVGLAAATGLMAKRASDAESASAGAQLTTNGTCPSVAPADQSPTGTTKPIVSTTTKTVIISATGTSVSSPVEADLSIVDVSNGCGDEDEKISGTSYTTRIFGQTTFNRHCNLEPKKFPMYGMLTQDFETCIDACASWSSKGAQLVGSDNANAKCTGVRFVPAWTDRKTAYDKNARGNCFLHSGKLTEEDLGKPVLADGVTCHAALLVE